VDAIVERYLTLGLRLDRHVDGFVDAYFGPEELAARVKAEPVCDPGALAAEAAELAASLPPEWQEERRRWLAAQLQACETLARRLDGDELSWPDLVERLYGVRPQRADERRLTRAQGLLDEALPGTGSLRERYEEWLTGQVVPRERIISAAECVCGPLRERAGSLARLPDEEGFELELVDGEPWWAYNYFLGSRRSRVAINTDLPVWSHALTELVAHELYPGHHTEGVAKEVRLVEVRRWEEFSLFLALAPQSLLAEGIATLALEQALGDGAHHVAAALLRPLGLPYDADTAAAIERAQRLLGAAAVDAAFQLHVEGRSVEEVREYLLYWTQRPREHVEKTLGFIGHPTWRAYVATYVDGYRVCHAYVDGDDDRFARLVCEPLLPADLAATPAA
jgi:hypothetical protein